MTEPTPTVTGAIADAIGYRPPTEGLLGSGFEQQIAYQRAAAIVVALGLPGDMPLSQLREDLAVAARVRSCEYTRDLCVTAADREFVSAGVLLGWLRREGSNQ